MRLALDATWCLHWRRYLQRKVETVIGFCINLMADSSPVFGHDWFLTMFELMTVKGWWDFVAAVQAKLVASEDVGNFSNEFWKAMSEIHTSVPTALGSARATLVHKVHAFLHSLIIELGSWELVRKVCELVVVVTTDMGVEAELALVPSRILTGNFLPHVFSDSASVWDGDLARLFPNALWIPGSMHVLSSITNDLSKCLESLDEEYLPMLRNLLQFLNAPWLLERFRHQCLPKPTAGVTGRNVTDDTFLFENVNISFAEWRWLSLILAAREVSNRMLPLRLYFRRRT